MKIGLFLISTICGLSFLQHGCSGAETANVSIHNIQNSTAVAASPTPASKTTSPPSNQNSDNNGIPLEKARITTELIERCKHSPVAVNRVKAMPLTGSAPLKVTFDGSSAYDPDGSKIVKWEWHFGNGQSREGRSVTYIYEKPGKYGIGLNVTDSQGQKTSDCSDLGTGINIVVTDNLNKEENPVQKEN